MTHRNADQRIREAFDALRAEIEAVFGGGDGPNKWPLQFMIGKLDRVEDLAHDFAKLPADA